jgi:CLIP-associating protein 1/2
MAHASQPVVEDAMRARAEQAESAAERLLELVEPEEDGIQHSTIPASLLVGSSNGHVTIKPKNKPAPISLTQAGLATPVTPMNRHAAILKQAAMFKDSPEYSRRTSSLIDVLHDKKHETGWWLKRRACVFFHFP